MFLCSAIPSRKFKITARTHIYKTHTHTLSSTHTYTYKYTTVKPIFNTVDLNVREPWGDKHTKNKPAWRQQITQRRRWTATLLSQRNKVNRSGFMFHVEFAEDKVVLIRKLFLFNSTSSNIFHLILPVKKKENKEFLLYICLVLLLQGLICSNFDVGENK